MFMIPVAIRIPTIIETHPQRTNIIMIGFILLCVYIFQQARASLPRISL